LLKRRREKERMERVGLDFNKSMFAFFLISLMGMAIFPAYCYASGTAVVWTDKDNYGPDDTVTIFGNWFLPSREVTITIEAPDSSVDTIYAWTDGVGAFTAYYPLNGIEGTYTVTATDGTNTATTTFTEAPKVTATWSDGDCADIKVTASSLQSGKNYYMTYTDPDGAVQRTTPTFPGPSAYTEYFVLDITLPKVLGTWTMKLYETPATLKDTDTVAIDKMVWTTDSTYAAMKTSFAQGETVYFNATGLSDTKYYNFLLDPPTGASIYVFSSYQGGVTQLTGSYVLSLTAKTGEWKLHVRQANDAEGTSHEGHYVDRYFTVTTSVPPVYTLIFDAVATSPLPDVADSTVIVTGTIGGNPFTVTNADLPKTFPGITSGTIVFYTFTDPVLSTISGKRFRLDSIAGPLPDFSLTTDTTITGNYKTQYHITFAQSAVGSDFTGVVVIIDSTGYSRGALPTQFWWDYGSIHSFAFQSPLAVGTDKQYVWVSTTGLSTLQSDPVFSVTASGSITGNYKTQYYLTLATSPSGTTTPTGAGWYDANTYASISTVQYVDIVPGSSRYRFNGWTTADMTEIANPSVTSTTVKMDKAKTVTANYVVQYRVRIEWLGLGVDATGKVVTVTVGGTPNIKNAGDSFFDVFVDAGTTVSYSYEDVVSSTVVGKRYKLDSVSGTSTTASHDFGAITGPITEIGTYKTQYLLTVLTNPSGLSPQPTRNLAGEAGPANSWWYEGSTNVVLTAQPVTGYTFNYWDVDVISKGSGVNPITVQMNAPHTATAHYSIPVPVGGVWVPINKSELLAPWIGLASLMAIATVSVIYVKHRKKQQK
jgi:hypothetical protein